LDSTPVESKPIHATYVAVFKSVTDCYPVWQIIIQDKRLKVVHVKKSISAYEIQKELYIFLMVHHVSRHTAIVVNDKQRMLSI